MKNERALTGVVPIIPTPFLENEEIDEAALRRLVEFAISSGLQAVCLPVGNHDPKKLGINLEKLVDYFDHICQLAGNALHIGFGADLDGLFGTEQTPFDMDTIADIVKFEEILMRRGYTEQDRKSIFSDNWLRVIKKAWT